MAAGSTSLTFDIYARDRASNTFDSVGDSAARSGDHVSAVGKKLSSFAKGALIAAGVGAVFAAKWGVAAVGAASDLNETTSKSEVIFGKNAAAMDRWASKADTALGLSKNAALASAAGFGDMFSQIGFADKATAQMSKSVVRAAADLGSFNNLPTADVADRMAAAFRGEYDSLQAVIPNINAARVEQVALAETGKKAASELTAQEKAAAVLAIVHKDGARAAGDYRRTQDGLANSSKTTSAMFENLKTKVGQGLLPVFVAGSKVLRTQLLPPLLDLADKYVPKVQKALMGLIDNADFSKLGKLDFSSLASGGAGIGASFQKIGDALKGIDLGQLGEAFGQGASDTISVFAVAIGFAADHIDILAKYLPLLVVAFIAYKSAQAASNVVSLASIPIMAGQVVANLSLASANRALAAQLALLTGAENVGMLARLRATVVTVASTVAQKTAALATILWTNAQWAFNVAMNANPIGLVVIAIAALAAGVIYAYTHFDGFRKVVDKTFSFMKTAIGAVLGFVKDHWSTILVLLGGPIGLAVVLIVKNIDKVKGVFNTFMDVGKKVFSAVGKAGTWLWNNALQPAFKFIAKGIGWLMSGWADMLGALGHVPGFGWAKSAAAAMQNAADKAIAVANGIEKIPNKKDVTITVTTIRRGGQVPGLVPGDGAPVERPVSRPATTPRRSGRGMSLGRGFGSPAAMSDESLLAQVVELLAQIAYNQRNGTNAAQGAFQMGADF